MARVSAQGVRTLYTASSRAKGAHTPLMLASVLDCFGVREVNINSMEVIHDDDGVALHILEATHLCRSVYTQSLRKVSSRRNRSHHEHV